MKEYKTFAKGIGLIGIINILIGLSSIILLPILTKNYSANEYGIWVQLSITVTLIPNIATLGLPYALIRFFAKFDEKKILDGFYSITVLVFISSLILSILLLIFSKFISDFLFGGYYAIALLLPPILFLACINLLYINYFLTFQKTRLYSLFLFLQSYLNIIFAFLFTWMNLDFIYIIIGFFLSQLIVCILMFLIVVRTIGLKIPQFKNIRSYLDYSIPTIPTNLAWWAVESSDRYLIGFFMGLAFVGYYNPGYNLAMMIKMLFLPFATMLTPALSASYDKSEHHKVNTYLKYSSKYFFLLAIPSAFGLSILAYPILNILTTSTIASEGFLVVPFIALTAIIYGANGIVTQVILLEKKTKISGIIWILSAVINIILNILLIPYIGIIGAAITTLLAYTTSFSLTLVYASKFYKFDFNPYFLVKSILASIVFSVFILLLNPTNIFEIGFAFIVAGLIYVVTLILIKGIKIDEIKVLLKYLI